MENRSRTLSRGGAKNRGGGKLGVKRNHSDRPSRKKRTWTRLGGKMRGFGGLEALSRRARGRDKGSEGGRE